MTTAEPGTESVLAALVGAIPGVVRLYPAGGVMERVGSALGAALGAEPGDGISLTPARISIRLAVDGERPAAHVCRDVFEVTRAWADANGMHDAVIEVTAASIDTEGAPDRV
ncbi:hypothetical protein [Leifsonia sp. AG29]|uniref:hypothetical protein n=1 Tax=Leifsonia sp. AG29 TaxID=2598860 RepID=UPI00131AE652|nr:hypothetical protein [Leifsonia sp. AG29]